MSYRYTSVVAAAVTLTTTSETAAATSGAADEVRPIANGVLVKGFVNVTAGTATTAVVIKVRRGSGTGGTQVGNTLTHAVAAAGPNSIPIAAVDMPGPAAGQQAPFVGQYTVTVTQTAATGNGTVNAGSYVEVGPAEE